MTDRPEAGGLDAVARQAAEAAAALDGLREPAERAAASIEDAFSRAGTGMARSTWRRAGEAAEACRR